MIADCDCTYLQDISSIPKSTNTESVASLLLEFFHYYAYIFNFEMDVISIREGKALNAKEKVDKEGKKWNKKINIEGNLFFFFSINIQIQSNPLLLLLLLLFRSI